MGLKSVFDIIKADRYSQAGCKEIEDARRYKTGEISEATGMQKQPDGSWAPPKKEAKQSAKTETKKPSKDVQKKIDEFNNAKAGAQRAADFMNNIKSGMPMAQAFEQSRQEPKAETKTDKTVEAIRNGGEFERGPENLNASADKISKRSGGKFKLTENKDPTKKGKYELKIGTKSYMVNSTEEAENFVDGYMETKEKAGSKPAISESGYGFTRGAKHYSRAKEH